MINSQKAQSSNIKWILIILQGPLVTLHPGIDVLWPSKTIGANDWWTPKLLKTIGSMDPLVSSKSTVKIFQRKRYANPIEISPFVCKEPAHFKDLSKLWYLFLLVNPLNHFRQISTVFSGSVALELPLAPPLPLLYGKVPEQNQIWPFIAMQYGCHQVIPKIWAVFNHALEKTLVETPLPFVHNKLEVISAKIGQNHLFQKWDDLKSSL